MCAGGPFIAGKGGDMLKAVSLNASFNVPSFGSLSSVAGYGSLFGDIVGVVTVLMVVFMAGVVLTMTMISGCDNMGWGKYDGMIGNLLYKNIFN